LPSGAATPGSCTRATTSTKTQHGVANSSEGAPGLAAAARGRQMQLLPLPFITGIGPLRVSGSRYGIMSPAKNRKLDLMILMGPFQLEIFYELPKKARSLLCISP